MGLDWSEAYEAEPVGPGTADKVVAGSLKMGKSVLVHQQIPLALSSELIQSRSVSSSPHPKAHPDLDPLPPLH